MKYSGIKYLDNVPIHYVKKGNEPMATEREIQDLKHNWIQDPCWDIELTEGFEDHREELFRYRKEMEKQWEKNYEADLEKFASTIGLPAEIDLKFANYLSWIEARIRRLEEKENT